MMYQMKSSGELKAMAREQLLGKYGTTALAFFIVSLITFAYTMVVQFIIHPNKSLNSMILYYSVMLLSQLVLAIFQVGQIRLYLNITCNCPYQISDIFYGFKVHPDKAILLTLFLTLINVACFVPFLLPFIWFLITRSTVSIVIMTLGLLASMVLATVISLMFSQVYFLLVDLPRYSAWELMKISKRITQGHKGQLFYLQVSFIGISLLSVFTCGIAYFWTIPYMNTTYTYFYLDLMAAQNPVRQVNTSEPIAAGISVPQEPETVPTEEVTSSTDIVPEISDQETAQPDSDNE